MEPSTHGTKRTKTMSRLDLSMYLRSGHYQHARGARGRPSRLGPCKSTICYTVLITQKS